MGNVSDLHNKAMECVDHAVMEGRRGNEKLATEFFEQALKFELTAIAELDDQNGLSWSILHRSAGWLALDCNQPRLAKELAHKALAGNPHPKVAEELRDLLKETHGGSQEKIARENGQNQSRRAIARLCRRR